MTDYNLPFSGNEVRDGLTRVVSPDLSPQSPSTKMVTSEGIKSALDAKLGISSLATDFTSPNNTTAPTTQAVQNLFNTADVTTITKTSQFTTTSTTNTTNITGTSIVGSRITKDGNDVYTIESGYYMVFCSLEFYAHLDRQAVIRFVGSGVYPHSPDITLVSGTGTSYEKKGFQTNLWFDGSENTFNLYNYVSSSQSTNNVGVFRNLKIAFVRIG